MVRMAVAAGNCLSGEGSAMTAGTLCAWIRAAALNMARAKAILAITRYSLCWSLIRGHYSRQRRILLRPSVGLENLLAQPQRLGRDFDHLIVGDKLNSLLQSQVLEGHQADGLIGRRGAHIG